MLQRSISFDISVVIETADKPSKFQVILPILKDIVNDHGIITFHEVSVI
ncbi:MAG: hypothetical protein D4R72_05795 [Nitrosopumilales archaeon]|jgi:PII-like signaling protein|nr:MAG: hypothetical protein D4R72_05795 [Nitrosopumilales archaeon]